MISIASLASFSTQSWDQYVNGAPNARLYHLSGWRHVVESTFGHTPHYLSAIDNENIVGVLPIVQLKSWAFGNMLVSLPYFNYGGICADHDEARDALLAAAVDLTRQKKADFLELRHDEDWCATLAKKTTKVSMRLGLPSCANDLWKSFPAKLRSQIQRPRKEGLTAVVGREDQLESFYEVFSANMRDLGTPVYSPTFFRNILRTFRDRTWIATVYSGTRPVASGFLAGFREQLEIPWASSLRAFSKSSPNMLLYWTVLEFACGNGYRVFDFGRSTVGEGTYRFKAQWGAEPHPLYWHYWVAKGTGLPQVNPANPKYRTAIALWRRLPLPLTRRLGPGIVKYIP